MAARGRKGGLTGGRARAEALKPEERSAPPMAAGVSKRLWEIGDIVALVEADEAKIDRKRGPYKKHPVASL